VGEEEDCDNPLLQKIVERGPKGLPVLFRHPGGKKQRTFFIEEKAGKGVPSVDSFFARGKRKSFFSRSRKGAPALTWEIGPSNGSGPKRRVLLVASSPQGRRESKRREIRRFSPA